MDAAKCYARLCFWVPPERLSEFEAAYASRLVPILKQHSLVESAERGRQTVEGVFSRLFEVESPAAVAVKQKALQEDPEFNQVLQGLGASFGAVELEGGIQYLFEIYRVPAGPGKVVPAGPGKKVPVGPGKGQWRTFDATDGLAGNTVFTILQGREGDLWFGTWDGGVSRYDGKTWTTFTTQDGLADNYVRDVFQDREGQLWFGTQGGGVSRYDGQVFQTLARQDGLAGNVVYAIGQDKEGALWFGTNHGVTRYRPPAPSPPKVFADAVVADRRYEGSDIVEVPAFVSLISFEFHGMSFKTRPEAMVYRYRLEGYEMEQWPSLEEMFPRLNRSLCRILKARTFVCLAMGEFDLSTRIFRLANSGCPYPYHYRAAAREVVELRVEAYPLGVRADTLYRVIEVQLEPGDRVVFCSDGIIEAVNTGWEVFGFERTAQAICKGCEEDLSSEALLERIIQEVKAFGQGVPQGDDQTIVVVKVEKP